MTAQAKPYAVRFARVNHVTYWRGRRRVHWTKDRVVSRFDTLDAAKRAARALVRQGAGLTIVWVAFKSRRVWTTDGEHEIAEKT